MKAELAQFNIISTYQTHSNAGGFRVMPGIHVFADVRDNTAQLVPNPYFLRKLF